MTIIRKTVDDGFAVTDPDDPRPEERLQEFCLSAHVHFLARDLEHAVELLALHFVRVGAQDPEASEIFHAGTMTLARREAIHGTPEARH